MVSSELTCDRLRRRGRCVRAHAEHHGARRLGGRQCRRRQLRTGARRHTLETVEEPGLSSRRAQKQRLRYTLTLVWFLTATSGFLSPSKSATSRSVARGVAPPKGTVLTNLRPPWFMSTKIDDSCLPPLSCTMSSLPLRSKSAIPS